MLAQRGALTAPADLEKLVQMSDTIVRGHVISAHLEPHPQYPNLKTVLVTISVSKVLKGQADSTFTFRQFIWDPRDAAENIGYRKASHLLLFLNPVSEAGLTSPVGLEQGRFQITPDQKGKLFAVNGRGNAGLFAGVAEKSATGKIALSKTAQAMAAQSSGKAPLESLEETISTLVEAQK